MKMEGESVEFKQNQFIVCPFLICSRNLCMKCFLSITLLLDMDECKGSNNVCDLNADCTNTEGSHNCTCKEGYIGDGKSCQGTK